MDYTLYCTSNTTRSRNTRGVFGKTNKTLQIYLLLSYTWNDALAWAEENK